jgi:hypothetical protein
MKEKTAQEQGEQMGKKTNEGKAGGKRKWWRESDLILLQCQRLMEKCTEYKPQV